MNYKLTPYTRISTELIDKLIIHHTVSDLRRSLERSPWIEKVEESNYVPTLYYRKGVQDPNIDDWTIHALCKDLHKFNLRRLADDTPDPPIPQCKYRSTLIWDNITGKSDQYPLVTYTDDQLLIFDGSIKFDTRLCGNYVGIILTMDEFDYNTCKDTIRVEYLNKSYSNICSNTLQLMIPFKFPGQEIPIKLIWDATHKTIYHVCVTQESTLMS